MTNPFGELISRGEGGYNSYNRGTVKSSTGQETIVHANKDIDFSQMTIAELQRRQALPPGNEDRIFAVGKYQFIPATLAESVEKLRIDPSKTFDAELQERLLSEYFIRIKRPNIYKFIVSSSNGTPHNAQKAVSKEWASVEDPDTPGHVYGEYEKHGNKMHTTAAQVAAALNQMRVEYQAQIDKGLSAAEAWQATTSMGPGQFQQIAKTHVDGHRVATAMLIEGTHSPVVGKLQKHLRQLGYTDAQDRPLALDNDFGPSTRQAIEGFQRDNGLSVDGVAGPHTWTALREAVHVASMNKSPAYFPSMATPDLDAAAVSALQQHLQTLGMTNRRGQPLPVTGIFDESTRIAVTMFQHDQGLPETGALDPASRALIEAHDTIAELQHMEHEHQTPRQDVPLREGMHIPTITADVMANPNELAQPGRTSPQTTPESCLTLGDPRNALSPLHALYNELKTHIPDASEQRLLQFAAVCHSHQIDADNLGQIYFDRQEGRMIFSASWPPGPAAIVDLKAPSPEPQQSIQHIRQHDQQHAQMVHDILSQNAQVEAQVQSGPMMGGTMR